MWRGAAGGWNGELEQARHQGGHWVAKEKWRYRSSQSPRKWSGPGWVMQLPDYTSLLGQWESRLWDTTLYPTQMLGGSWPQRKITAPSPKPNWEVGRCCFAARACSGHWQCVWERGGELALECGAVGRGVRVSCIPTQPSSLTSGLLHVTKVSMVPQVEPISSPGLSNSRRGHLLSSA